MVESVASGLFSDVKIFAPNAVPGDLQVLKAEAACAITASTGRLKCWGRDTALCLNTVHTRLEDELKTNVTFTSLHAPMSNLGAGTGQLCGLTVGEHYLNDTRLMDPAPKNHKCEVLFVWCHGNLCCWGGKMSGCECPKGERCGCSDADQNFCKEDPPNGKGWNPPYFTQYRAEVANHHRRRVPLARVRNQAETTRDLLWTKGYTFSAFFANYWGAPSPTRTAGVGNEGSKKGFALHRCGEWTPAITELAVSQRTCYEGVVQTPVSSIGELRCDVTIQFPQSEAHDSNAQALCGRGLHVTHATKDMLCWNTSTTDAAQTCSNTKEPACIPDTSTPRDCSAVTDFVVPNFVEGQEDEGKIAGFTPCWQAPAGIKFISVISPIA